MKIVPEEARAFARKDSKGEDSIAAAEEEVEEGEEGAEESEEEDEEVADYARKMYVRRQRFQHSYRQAAAKEVQSFKMPFKPNVLDMTTDYF